ncbi:MAG: HAD family hydrolase [Lachnospiraceae bacterium]|nr:HAD family hydrolase [Lachnospiraceae bacterium]
MNPRNDKTAFEYAEMLTGSGDTEQTLAVLDEITERNPTCKKAREFADQITGSNEDDAVAKYIQSVEGE